MSKNILLIEDQPIAAEATKFFFATYQQNITVAESGKLALTLIHQYPFKLILMDIGLPDLDGFTVTKLIRNTQHPNINTPILALTAHDNADYRKRAIELGMNDYLVKPLDIDTILNLINDYLS